MNFLPVKPGAADEPQGEHFLHSPPGHVEGVNGSLYLNLHTMTVLDEGSSSTQLVSTGPNTLSATVTNSTFKRPS